MFVFGFVHNCIQTSFNDETIRAMFEWAQEQSGGLTLRLSIVRSYNTNLLLNILDVIDDSLPRLQK